MNHGHSMTTVRDLRDWLDQFDGDVEVRFASQPRWAFENAIEIPEDQDEPLEIDGEKVIYLAEGQQIGYLPKAASVFVGWSEDDEEDEG